MAQNCKFYNFKIRPECMKFAGVSVSGRPGESVWFDGVKVSGPPGESMGQAEVDVWEKPGEQLMVFNSCSPVS